jgi:hypothetical protein
MRLSNTSKYDAAVATLHTSSECAGELKCNLGEENRLDGISWAVQSCQNHTAPCSRRYPACAVGWNGSC